MYNEKQYKSRVTEALFTIKGIVLGLVSALAISGVSSIFHGPETLVVRFSSLAKILFPSGALFGLCFALLQTAPAAFNLKKLQSIVLQRQAPEISVRVLVVGLFSIASVKMLYASCLFFAKSFHHQGLAALAFLFFLSVAFVAGLLLVPFFVRFLGRWIANSTVLSRTLGRPMIPICFIAGLTLGAVLPPLIIGPAASGAFGFIGLLRLQGGREAASLFLLAIVIAFLISSVQKTPKKEDILPPI
jgi:hypothetical protein